MFFFKIESWRGASLYATWVYFVLFWLTTVSFWALEPHWSSARVWSGLIGGLIGWLAGLSVVSDVKKIYLIRAGAQTRVVAALMAVPGALIGAWGNIVDIDSFAFASSVPMALVPALPMVVCLAVAGWSLVLFA